MDPKPKASNRDASRLHLREILWPYPVFLLIYLLFADKLAVSEIIAAALSAGVATAFVVAVRVSARVHFHPKPGWVWLLIKKFPGRVLRDCGVVIFGLIRSLIRSEPLNGKMLTLAFDPGGDDPESAARRALVTAAITVAPNTVAVMVDRESGLLYVHQLVETKQPVSSGNREWPL